MENSKGFYFDFVGNRSIAFVISLVAIVIGIASVIVKGGFDLGIEFAGGTLIEVRFSELPQVDAIRNAVGAAGFKKAVIQRSGEHTVLIRVSTAEAAAGQSKSELGQDMGKAIVAALQTGLGQSNLQEVLRVEQVGPQVGDELRRSAQLSLLFAIAGMILYIAWRFGSKVAIPIALIGLATIGLASTKIPLSLTMIVALVVLLSACIFFKYYFAFAAIVALIHDVIITAGAISLSNREMTLTIVAALLTIIGYSINDTIVIFDRIRENLPLMRGKPIETILNDSMNQTLTRTMLTSLTTLFVVVVMLVIGGQAINGFAFAMFVGIITGTYSSVFVATPILYVWHKSVKGGIFKKF
jgi:preprotein translocase subunit SecF